MLRCYRLRDDSSTLPRVPYPEAPPTRCTALPFPVFMMTSHVVGMLSELLE